METITVDKFWVLEWLENLLLNNNFSSSATNLITFIIACAILAMFIWVVDLIGSRIIMVAIHASVKKTETKWDDFLMSRKFFSRLMRLVPLLLVSVFIKDIFAGYENEVVRIANMLISCCIVVVIVLVISSFLDSANDVYESKVPERSIKGYIQTAKIIVSILGGILVLMIVFRKSPQDLFLGLGASAAIVTLVFKDTILGFVASIQLSAQDMIRKGDWIEIPKNNIDGVVTDINLNSVKVRNWNNTLSMVPIYSLVSESFTNWRNMEESEGRRFKRPITIDITSVKILSKEEIEKINTNPFIKSYANNMTTRIKESETSPFITNVTLYRSYITAYLLNHPNVNSKLPLIVRYTTIGENGMSLEIYAFSAKKDFVDYEAAVCDIFDNIIAVTSIFDLRLYQHPSGTDLKTMNLALTESKNAN